MSLSEVPGTKSPINLDVAPIKIRAAPGDARIARAESPGDSGGFLRPFANHQLNSRLSCSLPKGVWSRRRQTPLEPTLEPVALLYSGDRILLQGKDLWQLLNSEGNVLAFHSLGASDVFLDPPHDLFYLADRSGYVAARRSTDGGEEFVLSTYFGDNYRRSLIARQAALMTIVSVEMRIPHRISKPDESAIEVQDLGEKRDLGPTGRLRSARRLRSLRPRTALLLPALLHRMLVLATSNWIYVADEDLHVRTALRGEFEPACISLDEEMRIYLVVRTQKHKALWVLTEEGKRLVSFALPVELPLRLLPPIVGYDHQVYLVVGDRLVAVSQSGKMLWEQRLQGRYAGATVTPDDRLLVAAGSSVVSYDLEGESRVLHEFGNEELCTPPILTEEGMLMVASTQNLFCLTTQSTRKP